MGPMTLGIYDKATPTLRAILSSAQHWFLDHDFLRPLTRIAEDAVRSNAAPVFEMALPGETVVVELPEAVFVFNEGAKNRINVFCGNGDFFKHVLTVNRYEDEVMMTSGMLELPQRMQAAISRGAVCLDFFFSVIAEPRLVIQNPVPRPFRRSAKRKLGFSPVAWRTVSWTVGRQVHAKVGLGDEDHGVALHVVRAHWRFWGHQTEKTVYRNGSRGKGWYLWIKHHFKGHPDFGVKLHHYKPKLGPESDPAIRAARQNATLAARDQMVSDWSKQKEP